MPLLIFLLTILLIADFSDYAHHRDNRRITDHPDNHHNGLLIAAADTIIQPAGNYSDIIFQKKEMLASAPGTKSVLFNSTGTRLYAMNLEGMSVYEFDQATK